MDIVKAPEVEAYYKDQLTIVVLKKDGEGIDWEADEEREVRELVSCLAGRWGIEVPEMLAMEASAESQLNAQVRPASEFEIEVVPVASEILGLIMA